MEIWFDFFWLKQHTSNYDPQTERSSRGKHISLTIERIQFAPTNTMTRSQLGWIF